MTTPSPSTSFGTLQHQLDSAQRLMDEGKLDEAENAYARVLVVAPNNIRALNVVAMGAFRHEKLGRSLELLQRAIEINPSHPPTLINLGIVQRSFHNLPAALQSFRRALDKNPELSVARLYMADVLDRLGEHHKALVCYFRAITTAQAQGRWLNAETTPGGLRSLVSNGMRYINQGRRQLFNDVLAPLRSRYGDDELKRVAQCLAAYLGDESAVYSDPRQRPGFLHFPEIPATPYLDRKLFPWVEQVEELTSVIRREMNEVASDGRGLQPVFHSKLLEDANLKATGSAAPTWNGYYFYRYGKKQDENTLRCPRTAAMLETLPLAHVRDHAPEVLFSVFTENTHLLPHRGVTNTRVVAHLPLIVPQDCALVVAGQLHAWKEGQVVVFDDTYEHEAWNRSKQVRVVLIMDLWSPYLTPVERLAIADLVAAIGDFRTECEAV